MWVVGGAGLGLITRICFLDSGRRNHTSRIVQRPQNVNHRIAKTTARRKFVRALRTYEGTTRAHFGVSLLSHSNPHSKLYDTYRCMCTYILGSIYICMI